MTISAATEYQLVAIKVLDRTYKVKCLATDAQDLQTAANCLDEQMRKVRQSGHLNNSDSIAIVAGLNLAQQMVVMRRDHAKSLDSTAQHIQQLIDKLALIMTSDHG